MKTLVYQYLLAYIQTFITVTEVAIHSDKASFKKICWVPSETGEQRQAALG
jgi:hypothetical protein